MRFGYLKDPLFLVCFAVYWLHRLAAASGYSTPFLRSYLNDLICLPFWLPMMLWVLSCLRLRAGDGPPQAYEVVIPLMLWATVFEVLLPLTPRWSGRTFADPFDILCYALGGLGAMLYWYWRYRPVANIRKPAV